MEKLTVTVKTKSGLHARPASMLVGTSKNFSSNITLQKHNKSANGKSIMSVLGIAAKNGDSIEIVAEGTDEAAAIQALKELFEEKLILE
ncbi:HPr family phosphocarrier protein [Alkaliphilus peptidifermentans]|uniref:Phosphocarrier protein HPr n=1 Tax=Alkaliphilus peptidifermentans DSM 18978 TaxID=1120976 RepID=A0A1G5FAV1_9FIRM|nr:HPr family phosphocarrier protein [Alkaliphilus peptidifermentans]SCY36379.1 phosphocarrier protein [Alkaliphilus peptidifermentans DSM 18978]